MSGHLDGPPPGPPDPPYIPGDLGAPSAKEFARRRAGDRHMNDNPYPNASDTMHYELHTAWDEGYAEGFAAGRAAATPDPPPDDLCAVVFRALHSSRNTQMSDEMRAAYIASVITAEAAPAASPDERLREALATLVAAFPSPPDREMDDEEIERWYADHGDWFRRLTALIATDRRGTSDE